MLITLFLLGALACDANADGRTTVDELVAGVAAALAQPVDCAAGCATCAPSDCGEFPTYDGVTCDVALCTKDIERCVPELAATPGVCR